MSLPNNEASTSPLQGVYLPPEDRRVVGLQEFEQAGIAINDTSADMLSYRWQVYVTGDDVYMQREGADASLVFSQSGITAVTFAFDQNMRPTVAYSAGNTYLRWYDSATNSYKVDSFGVLRNPKLTLDDKRTFNTSNSDIIFAYITADGKLCYRQQRDRYTIERVLSEGLSDGVKLKSIGMSRNLRLQFNLA